MMVSSRNKLALRLMCSVAHTCHHLSYIEAVALSAIKLANIHTMGCLHSSLDNCPVFI